jgi:hypothetical protein
VVLKYDNPNLRPEEREKHKPFYTRVKNFEARHGAGQTELNALREEEIAQILAREARRYRDPHLWSKLSSTESEAQQLLDEETEERIGYHRGELDNLVEQQNSVVSGYRELFERLEARMQRELTPIHERVREINDEMEEDLEGYGDDLELPERPEPEVGGDNKSPLYDSDRDYFDQLNHYRRYKGEEELTL